MDFSNMFRNVKQNKQKPSKKIDESINQDENQQKYQGLIDIQEIVKNQIVLTLEQMQEARYLDQKRWFCLSRPQYKRSCGISSLVSCWNYLFSQLGNGDLPVLSQEEALLKLGVIQNQSKSLNDIDFGNFTGNQTLINWFRQLLKIYNLKGRAYMFWKMCGKSKTEGIDERQALIDLKEGLRNPNMSFIYHAHDHYFCPMGYEYTPLKQEEAYTLRNNQDEGNTWILIGEPSKVNAPFLIKKWSEISMDISLGNPQYYNIRKPELGVMERKSESLKTGKLAGTSMHCIMAFEKIPVKKLLIE